MEPATKEEKAWMAKLQKLLLNPPSDRLGIYVTGDPCLSVYDKTYDAKIDRMMMKSESTDFCQAVDELGIILGTIDSATNIQSTAG